MNKKSLSLFGITFIAGVLIKRAIRKNKRNNTKKITINVYHAGNQPIPEFYECCGKAKCVTFKISENSSIAEVKDKIAKQVQHVDRTISLFAVPFGKKLQNITIVKNIFEKSKKMFIPRPTNNNADPLNLFIVIPNY